MSGGQGTRWLGGAGRPGGLELGLEEVPAPWKEPPPISSILVILATDAPLLPHQCRRLAEHATIGLARAGGQGLHTSGDLFLAFATGTRPARCGRETSAAAPA